MAETDKKIDTTTETESENPKTDNEHQRKLNVGNLPQDVTEQQLRDHFSGHEIEKIDIFHYRKYTIALLLFKDKEAATAALSAVNGTLFRNRRLRIHLEYITIRHIKREFVVTVIDDENLTEEQLWDKVKAAEVEPTSVLIFYPLGYITLQRDTDKLTAMDKLKKAGFNVHDVNQRDQNQHLDILREAKLFYRNRNRVQLLNIPTQWIDDKEEMKKQCAEGGTITEAVSNNVNQNSSNYARIFYETEEQAVKATKALNGRLVDGKRIHAIHLGSALIPNYKTSVYVSPLEKPVTEEQVYDHFKQFGEIDFVNRRNCIDSAIICYKNATSVEKALASKTFPAPTEENKDATKEITVNKYDGPLVIRPSLKRKLQNPDGTPIDVEQRTKDQKSVLEKLQNFHPIFVGNVPMHCPPLDLKRYFAQAGPIKFMFSPQILTYRASAPHPVKTFLIYYQTSAHATQACKFLDHKFFGGHRLHVVKLRREQNFNEQKTVKVTKIPHLSEDALFKKIKPFVGKINRIVKKNRLAAYVEFNDPADVEKFLKPDTPDHPLPKAKFELVKGTVSVRLYNEDDPRVLNGIAKIVAKNPEMLSETTPIVKRPRMQGPGGFNRGPGGYNSNNNMNNPQAIQDLLRLAFMSGKNVGESLASNQGSFNSDPPLNNFGDGGFRNNRNNQGGQNNFRSQGRNPNQNQNQNRANNSFGNNNNAGGNNFQNRGQNNSFNQNRGNQPNNQNNQQQNRGLNLNQGQNRMQQNNPGQNQNRNNIGSGNNLNRNQNQNQNNQNRNQNRNFDNDSFSGGNNFGNNRNNNFANDNFTNDNFGNNFSNDSFGNNRNNNFGGGNNRTQNDNSGFNNSFGNKNNTGGNNRFGGNNDGQFNSFNRNQNNFDDNNSFGNNQKNNFAQNRQNKPFNNNSGNNQGGGGGGSFNDFNNTNRNNSGGFNSGNNTGGNKWNNNSNSQQTNTGSRLAGSIFSRRF
ncbi:uncharacterized protein LOC129739187 [Uranotaenia lowii]|uniref:uncharacterized protein LOC129739187 n=1 Tax=Uranotaenia lowii TaxID=190385 RepID=UPI002479EE2C|nr:uncharacterized protein LOC129739187 [Uranotaenia lowii]